MKRKKFIKQLMALGYQRNTAEALAVYARCGGWTYEQYLEVERKYNGQLTAIQTAAGRMAAWFAEGMEHLSTVVKGITDKLQEVFAGFNTDIIMDWLKENAPQIAEQHMGDAVDALTYVAQGGGGHV